MSEERKEKSSLISKIVLIAMLLVVCFTLYPICNFLTTPKPTVLRALTESLLSNLTMALESYSSDFNGHYPPDMSSNPKMMDGTPIKNSSQLLCYFIEFFAGTNP